MITDEQKKILTKVIDWVNKTKRSYLDTNGTRRWIIQGNLTDKEIQIIKGWEEDGLTKNQPSELRTLERLKNKKQLFYIKQEGICQTRTGGNMCSICHATPCLPRCPNEEKPKVVHKCVCCQGDIVEGEEYYDINGEKFCEECIYECRCTAESYE